MVVKNSAIDLIETNRVVSLLIVDDHPMVISGLISCLSAYTDIDVVGQAADGLEGIELYQRLKPDVVLMDINMPRMDGFSATRHILKNDKEALILMFSMHESAEMVANTFSSGAKGYVLKDTAADELHLAIDAVSEGRSFVSGSVASNLVDYQAPKFDQLTDREQTILAYIADGYSSREISSALSISIRTVDAHRRNIKAKLEIDSLAELVRYALVNKITAKV